MFLCTILDRTNEMFAMVGNDDVRGAGSLCSLSIITTNLHSTDEDGVAPELILNAQS